MSRFIKQGSVAENVYIQFRFESSLRKYESKPIKKIKSERECNNCMAHHNHKMQSNSPISQRCVPFLSKGKSIHQQNTIQRHSGREHLSGSHMVSSNKTIKLSKRKQLEEISSNKDELQRMIYASLVNIGRVENKQEKSNGDADDVYLNDFEPSMDMDGEEEGEGDVDFGKIQIAEKGSERVIEDQVLPVQNTQKELYSQVKQQSNENQEQEHRIQRERIDKIKEEDDISEQLQALRMAQMTQQLDLCGQKFQVQQLIEEVKQQVNTLETLKIAKEQPKVQIFQNELCDQLRNNQSQKLEDSLDHNSIDNKSQLQNPFIRSRPAEESVMVSALIEQHHIIESMKQKCLAFQGGRIYVDSFGQNFYISMRVLNRMRRQCSNAQDLINLLIHQRPYLQEKKDQIKGELQQYIKNAI